MSELDNPLLANSLSSSANAGMYEAGDTISTIHGDMTVTGVDHMGRPQVDQYGEDLNWEDSFGPASKHLGVSEGEWQEFISGVNEVKAAMRQYEGNEARVMQNRSVGDAVSDRRIAKLIHDGYTQEEAEAEVYGSEQYAQRQAEFEEYEALNQQLNDLYNSVGLDSTGAIQGSGTNSPGYAVNFDFVSGDVSHSKGDAIHDIGKMAVMGAASIVAGPALAGALGGVLGPAAAKAASSAILSIASQYMTTGEVDFTQALISAATAYGGAKLGDVLKGSGMLGEIGGKVTEATDKFNELISTGNSIADAAIKAGGMSMLTQLVTTGEIDIQTAAMSALMAAGSQGFAKWQASMIDAGQPVSDDLLQEITVEAKRVGNDLGNGMYELDGVVFSEEGGYIGNMTDLDLNGDGALSGDDLQNITTPDRELVDPTIRPDNNFGYEMGDDVYVDANGNPVDPSRVKFGPDGYVVDGQSVTTKPYNEVFGGDKGGLEWKFGLNEDGSVSDTDGSIYYENGELAYEKVDGQWTDADGNIIDDPTKVDELGMIAAKAVDAPLESVQYYDQDGNPVNYKYAPYELRDSLENGQFSGLIFGPNGEVQEVWYDPTTGTEYIKSDEGFQGVEQVELPDETPETPDTTDDSSPTGDPNEDTDATGDGSGGGPTNATGGTATPGVIGGGGAPGGGSTAGGAGGDINDLPPLFLPPLSPPVTPGTSGGPGGEVVDSTGDGNVTGDGVTDGGTTGGTSGGDNDGDATDGDGDNDGTGDGTSDGDSLGDGTGGGTTGNGGGTSGTGDETGDGTGEGGGAGGGGGTGGGTGGGAGGNTGGGTGTTTGPTYGTSPGPGGTGTGAGGGGNGGLMSGGSGSGGDDYNPSWGELFAYSVPKGYEKKAVARQYKDYIQEAKGLLS